MFGKMREIMNFSVNKVYLLRRVGSADYKVVKIKYVSDRASDFKIGKRRFAFSPRGNSFGLKNVRYQFRDFDDQSYLRLTDRDYVVTSAGQIIPPELLEVLSTTNDVAAAGRSGTMELLPLLLGCILGVFVGLLLGVLFGDALLGL